MKSHACKCIRPFRALSMCLMLMVLSSCAYSIEQSNKTKEPVVTLNAAQTTSPLSPTAPIPKDTDRPVLSTKAPIPTIRPTAQVVLEKVDEAQAFNLGWNEHLAQFIYNTYSLSQSTSLDSIEPWAFEPISRSRTPYNESIKSCNSASTVQHSLNAYQDMVFCSPSGTQLVFVRAEAVKNSNSPLPVYSSVELWHSDIQDLKLTKLGSIPLPFIDDVMWLDNEQNVLITIKSESLDAGLAVFSFRTDGTRRTELFDPASELGSTVQDPIMAISVSPNSRWLSVVTLHSGLWVIDPKTGSAKRIENSAYYMGTPLWSRDSQYFYYIRGRYGFPHNLLPPAKPPVIVQYNVTTDETRVLSIPGEIGIPAIVEWSISDDGHYFLVSTESGSQEFLPEGVWLVTMPTEP